MSGQDDERAAIAGLALRHRVSEGAVAHLLAALRRGGGAAAQFDHPELGGMGQWMAGGMVMIGDWNNHALKATVAQLCAELAPLASRAEVGAAAPLAGGWWPAELGAPSASGGQDGARYAYFAAARRLAVEAGGRVTVYDTLDHHIEGVAQQQGRASTLSFRSQLGAVALEGLPRVAEYRLG